MFHKIFSKNRRSLFSLKISISTKNVLLNGEIVVGYCKGYETILLFFLIDGFKEKTIRLYEKEIEW